MTNTTTTVRLGQSVTYRDTNGRQKAAIVVGTFESIEPGHGVTQPEEGNVNLTIFSPSGNRYTRENVRPFTGEDGGSTQTFEV